MACGLGVTPRVVRDDMTLDDVLDLFDYWREAPPVQWMVQEYLGINPTPKESPAQDAQITIPSVPWRE